MIIERQTRDTLTAVELDKGDTLQVRLADGTVRRITLESTSSSVDSTTLADLKQPRHGAHSVFRAHCQLRIDGTAVQLVRWYGNQLSFNPPWELFGLRLWFDATQDLFDLMSETHGACKPRKHARFALQDATRRICPVLLHPWCPLPAGGLRIEHCYDGSDCWLGPYFGAEAHGGLDLNHPAGTRLWTPIAIDDHALFDRLETGANNNRWRGSHRWPDGSTWILQSHHLIRLLAPEHTPLPAGLAYAESGGMLTGSHEHSHFVFKVREPEASPDDEIALDPWILFWQMYQDRNQTNA